MGLCDTGGRFKNFKDLITLCRNFESACFYLHPSPPSSLVPLEHSPCFLLLFPNSEDTYPLAHSIWPSQLLLFHLLFIFLELWNLSFAISSPTR